MRVRDKTLRHKNSGLSFREIAARCVAGALKGRRLGNADPRRKTLTERVCELSRLSTEEIAAATGASPDFIRRVLNRDGRGNYAKAVLAVASPDKTLSEIAREVGCSFMTVKRISLLFDVPHCRARRTTKSSRARGRRPSSKRRVFKERGIERSRVVLKEREFYEKNCGDGSNWDAEYRAAMAEKNLPGMPLKGDAWERYRKLWQARRERPNESARARIKRLFGKDEKC